MRILVVDDNEQHRRAAHAFLKDHDLTVVGDFGKAQTLLGKCGRRGVYKNNQSPSFDVVLTDLMLPASDEEQGPDGMKFVGQEMPLGTTLMLRAIACGVKYVACITDTNHHHHPASAAFDGFGHFTANGIVGMCSNNLNFLMYADADTLERIDTEFLWGEKRGKYPEQEGGSGYKGVVWVKNWGLVLNALLNDGKLPGIQEAPDI